MNVFRIILLLTFLYIPLHAQLDQKKSFALMDSMPLYAEPSADAPEIATVREGENVVFYPPEKGWIKVDFFAEKNAWVASCFLKKGVYTENVIFRTDPTAAAAALCRKKSSAGEKAEIIGSDKTGYWKKVRLKCTFSGYISQKELENVLKKKNNSHTVKHSPVISTAIGMLLPLEKPYQKATHKLVYKVNEAEYLVAYIIPDKVNLKLWENWMIYLSGECIWNPSIQTPFMKGANIFPAYR